MNTDIKNLSGYVRVRIKPQEARPRWMQKALQKALEGGQGAPNELRFACRIAQDVNDTFESVELGDGTKLTLNPKGKAQFGRNAKGHPYLTVGVIWSENGAPYRLHWEAEGVPLKMQQVAVKHDEGRKVGATTVALKFSDAVVARVRHDLDKKGRALPRKPHRGGSSYPPRSHDRICAADLPQS
ncbi:hypothetical protein [Agromyces sp. NBRC 114283]|uniref:hypothetical protein n=1 Tax=Agromyces sp. NBRC 114283 TaxID=2994521 RepID=UPI0024A0E79B|nr:hypothetical protein [Agromyces sp. NBRC 114283]GLU88892.1 hypothetical protein Agsp01_11470 [Agromyces sp. NBRC 114283]